MTQPPSESGNVVDPEVLASRRARRAEVSEDATLELRLLEAERRLGEVAAERDALRGQVARLESEVTGTRQREWAEQQQRLEAQGEAAAARELAGSQLAALRERLAAAEAEVAVVAAERDRARRALEDERLRTTAERERREALEREGLLLRAELARRPEPAAAPVPARDHQLEARIAAERAALSQRVQAVEAAVSAVRDRLGVAARGLREQLEAAESALGAERSARLRADGELAELRGELDTARGRVTDLERERAGLESVLGAERVRTIALERELGEARERVGSLGHEVAEAQARAASRGEVEALRAELARRDAALAAVTQELDAVRAGDGERIAQLQARVESVIALASGQDELLSSLAAMRERVAELQEGVAQLEAERAARWVAESELDAERRRGDADRARLADVEAELTDLRSRFTPPTPTSPSTLASLRSALDALQAATPTTTSPALSLDLSAAAARLRAATTIDEETPEPPAVEEPPAVVAPEPPAVEEPPAAIAPEPPAAEEPALADPPPAAEAPLPAVDPWAAVAPEPLIAEEPALADPPPAAVAPEPPAAEAPPAADASPARQLLPARSPVQKPGPWLRDALVALARDEPEIAELVVVGLLPLQAELVPAPFAYILDVDAGGTHRVAIGDGEIRVGLPSGSQTIGAEPRAAGPLEKLVPLATGGTSWRLPGARVSQRRQLKKLIKARRRPVGLQELAETGIAPSPGLLLTVLARAVDPAWTKGLTVDIAPEQADRWRVAASGIGPLAILPADGAPPAPATLHVSAGRLAAVLAGTADPSDAHVEGDLAAVRTLLHWFDRAQRGGR
ncbi:hypothetical protein [Conexibacter woesei]|uniref:hypothetical protein n=1 Tax=Conexibacter woesei TaxID=191495 RepID=UPI0003FB35EF|nr:hypothetical protein [Conexibacter woesei]